MVNLTEDFSTLSDSVWTKVLNQDSDIQATNGLGFAIDGPTPNFYSGDGNYLFPNTEIGIISVVDDTLGNTNFQLSGPHGQVVNDLFYIHIAGNTSSVTPPEINGYHVASSTGTDTFKVLGLDISSLISVIGDGVCRVPRILSGTSQETQCLGLATVEGATNGIMLWSRLHKSGGPLLNLRAGYGFQAIWGIDGARTLLLWKVDSTSGTLQIMKSITGVDFIDADDNLHRLQHLRLVTYDHADTVGGEVTRVVVRGYLNEDDDALPTIEYVDRGSEEGNPIHRDPGTFGLSFTVVSQVVVDSWEGTDEYVIPAFGIQKGECRTRLEFRESLYALMSRANNNDIDTDRANMAIEYAISHVHNDMGDDALWRIKSRKFDLTAATDGTIELPWDIDRVIQVFETTGKYRVPWAEVIHDGDGDRRYIAIGNGLSGVFYVRYLERWEQLDEDTDCLPIPRRHDEVALLAAGMRMARHEHDQGFEASLRGDYTIALDGLKLDMKRRKGRQKHVMTIGRSGRSPFQKRSFIGVWPR
tara:strand:- start:4152 stop:5738 length:1587 start_codon:yes stop_codon:yes gene_type:complete